MTTPPAQFRLHALEAGLDTARAKVRSAAVRRALVLSTERVALVAAGTGVCALVVAVVDRLDGSARPGPVYAAVGAGVLVAGVSVVRRLRGLAVDPVDAVAERFDLAAADHNAVATALDFARNNDDSPMARRAIDAGLRVLGDRAAAVEPVTPRAAVRPLRTLGPLAAGVALTALSLLLPAGLMTGGGPVHSGGPAVVALAPLPPAVDARKPADPPGRAKAAAAAAPAAVPQKPSPATPSASPASDRPGTAAAAGSSDAPSASPAAESAATPQSQKQDKPADTPAAPASPQSEPQTPAAPKAAAAAQKAAAAGQSDSPSKSNGKNASGSAKADSPAGEQDGQKGSESADNARQPDANGDSPPGEKGDSPGGQNGSGEQPGKSPGSGSGRSSSSSDQDGGNGQSSGQSPPKKSRGVAPLLLGSRQADLLLGRPLPGPDERTRIQMPAVPQPLDPAADSATAARTAPEPATGIYRVPADRRDAVDAYFRRFHQDPTKP